MRDGAERARASGCGDVGRDVEAIRVILVGRTGLEQALRHDPSVELVRAAGPLEAMGELRDPMDADSPVRAVVVLGPDAEPCESPDAADRWAISLRRLDPGVRVLRVSGNGESREGGPYDDVIGADLSPEALGQRLRGLDREDPTPEFAHAPPGEPEPRHSTPDPSGAARLEEHDFPLGGVSEPGDQRLVAALIQGRDPLEPALALIRERLGADAVFVRDEGAGEDPPSALGGRVAVEVAWRGRRFGWLGAGIAEERSARAHASWLASWLRLGEQQRELRRAAFIDPLTGAWNRRYFDRFLGAAIDRARQRRGSVTVLVFDIDDFKSYNDRYGHAAGDEILVETVRLIGSMVRPTDRVCRVGGDEFAVIFDEPDGPREPGSKPPESIWQISQRFQKEICQHRFPKLGAEAPGTLTISGGLATFPWDGHDARELIERADGLSMESKSAGKNAITFGPGSARVCRILSDDPDRHEPEGQG